MKVLFIGGTGTISSACTRLAVKQGVDLYLINRGKSKQHGLIPDEVHWLIGDKNKPETIKVALGNLQFDAVVNWIVYYPEQIERDLALFQDRTNQYIFISSASAYQKPPSSQPITESTILHNPYWTYSRNKIACEERLIKAYREDQFPATIVRPSHTYDKTMLPFNGGFTVVDRMRKGRRVIVHGDGTSLWTLTHHEDFATAFIALLGNNHAIGEAFHITSDESLSWNQIYNMVATAAGVPDPRLIHVPSELIAAYDSEIGDGLLGDKAHSMIFDNTKIKRIVPEFVASIPFAQGAREIIAWYDEDSKRKVIDDDFNELTENILTKFDLAWPDIQE